jgi:hypothetical protein
MNDFELHHGLDLLADEAEPAAVDVYGVIAKANARTRNRRATMATALATVTVAGAMIATISFGAGTQSAPVGAPPSSSPPITGWSPPGGPTMTASVINDNQMVAFTEQLEEAWPSIKPQGVTTAKLDWFAGGLDPLEVHGFRTTEPPNSITYATAAQLSDAQGSNELLIHIIKVGPHDWPFESLDNSAPDSTHDLPDGTHVEIRSSSSQRVTQVVRPYGTAIQVTENNIGSVDAPARPDFILDTEALLKLATALSYS